MSSFRSRKLPSSPPSEGRPGPSPLPEASFHGSPSVPQLCLPTDLTAWPLTPLPHLRSNRPWTRKELVTTEQLSVFLH